MTATGHALIGALIAAKFTHPAIGLPLSFFSHFAADFLPHWDSGTNESKKTKKRMFYESVIDVIVSLISSYVLYTTLLASTDIVYLYLNVFASQLPDWLFVPYYYLKIKWRILKLNIQIQEKFHNTLDKPWGILTQIIAISMLYILLFIIL